MYKKENWFGERRTVSWDEFLIVTHNPERNKDLFKNLTAKYAAVE